MPKMRSELLTQKDLMARWNCHVRSVQRLRREAGLLPVDFIGQSPLFRLEDVEAAEAYRLNKGLLRLARARQSKGLIAMNAIHAAKRAAKEREAA